VAKSKQLRQLNLGSSRRREENRPMPTGQDSHRMHLFLTDDPTFSRYGTLLEFYYIIYGI